MDKYLFKKEFDGRYCLIEDNTDEFIKRMYCVDYPSVNDDDDLNWSFFFIEVNGTAYECSDWNVSTEEQEKIKNYIRIVLKPDDLHEYDFVNDINGRVRVKSIEVDGGYVDYYVDYPCKQEGIENWKFYIGKNNNTTNGEFITENWNISNLEAEYLKSYIRNILKPNDLYEENEEKEMENNKNMICTGLRLPSENYKTVMEIAKKFGCEEDETVYMQLEQTPNLIQELEVCKNDKEIITKEWNKTKEILNNNMDEARTVMIELLEFITTNNGDNEVLEPTIKTLTERIGENAISKFGLEDYLPKENKYDVVTIDVTQIRTRTIEAVVPHDSYSESDIDNFIKGECSYSLDDTFNDVDEYEYEFSTHSSYDSNLTAKEIVRRYDLDGLFPGTSEIEDEVF